MSLAVPAVLRALGDSTRAAKALAAWRRRARGDQRALVMELTDNLALLDLVAEEGVPLGDVVGRLSTADYDRLAKAGFDFNALQRRRIRHFPSLDGTDLRYWPGKSTAELVESIYRKLRDLKLRYPHLADDAGQRWGVRVNNIRKRTWLLLRHVG